MADNELEIEQILRDHMRTTRAHVFDLAIQICKDLSAKGGCAMCCAIALERAKANLEDRIAKGSTKPVLEIVKGGT